MTDQVATANGIETAVSVVRRWAERPRRAVIFDFNGTLSDDEPILERIFTALFAEHLGWTMTAGEYATELLGHSDREIVQIAVARHGGGDPALVEELLARRRAAYKEIVANASPITSSAVALVQQLHAASVPMAIVTGAQREDVLAVVTGSDVDGCFQHLVTEEDVEAGKPDPEGFLAGARLLGVDANDVLVFEDSVPGVRAAARAGMACIAVAEPSSSVVDELDPRAVVPALTDELVRGLVL